MKIAVCVDTTFVSQELDVAHIQKAIQKPSENFDMIIEPSSVAAIQLADSLAKEKEHITAITYGGPSNQSALEYALAFGITSVVHLIDEDSLANPSDPQGVANAIGIWLKDQGFDLIICGNPSGTGLVPSLIAGNLDIPCVSRVYKAKQRKAEKGLELNQRLERGWTQRVFAKLPAVITVQDGYFPTKYISVRHRRVARDNIHTVQVVQSKREAINHTLLKSVTAPRTRAKRTAIPDSTASATDRLQSLIGGGGGFGAAPKPAASKQDEEQGVIDTTPDKAAKKIIEFLEEKELLPERIS